MVFVLLTYGGWNEAAYISAEVKGGPRGIVRTLVLSILVITAIYVRRANGEFDDLNNAILKEAQQ